MPLTVVINGKMIWLVAFDANSLIKKWWRLWSTKHANVNSKKQSTILPSATHTLSLSLYCRHRSLLYKHATTLFLSSCCGWQHDAHQDTKTRQHLHARVDPFLHLRCAISYYSKKYSIKLSSQESITM